MLRCGNGLLESCGHVLCIEGHSVDDIELIDVSFLKGQRKAVLFGNDWPGKFKAISLFARRSRGKRKRISRIEAAAAISKEKSAVVAVRTRLGQDFNLAAVEWRKLIFGRKKSGEILMESMELFGSNMLPF